MRTDKKIFYLKQITFILFFVFSVICANAQLTRPVNNPRYDFQRLHFGFTIGINSMDFTIHNSGAFFGLDSIYSVENQPQPGFNLGIISDLKIVEGLNLRFLPGLNFGQRDMTYIVRKDSSFYEKVMKIESTFLDFPLVFKYRALRHNDYRPYLIAGGSLKYDLAAQKEIKDEEKPKIRLNRTDLYYQFGLGIDFYLPYFKFSTEIKYEVGMFNMLQPDNTQYSSAIERMNSKLIMISFHFE
ncbi:MAG: hypothetical protein A2W98_09050 [Bacteroidetes bacterium GWF2_33_38]|nr:MAG: hypothetical protein A2W98_09050 [Bacteroidetes bacterium GWF2_33_38]OFY73365.1 MAG: hypothetical protein A2265_02370 [Bacteroidetes bacterium RIFOXYA12_FULL_33_9]OFY88772.1 MAG: hypothetical protein A2236_03775 [Bacteroidetes bacterium RIFOXYA2_FULL_33_7]